MLRQRITFSGTRTYQVLNLSVRTQREIYEIYCMYGSGTFNEQTTGTP